MATLPTNISTTSAKGAHDIVAKLAFELVGVAVLAIAADLNDTLGTLILILMISFLFFWFVTKGAGLLNRFLIPFNTNPPPGPPHAFPI